jgi:hypothetical protein
VVRELIALGKSAARPPGLEQVIAYRKALARALVELGTLAKQNDGAAVERLGKPKATLHKELREAAHVAGLEECGSTGPA